MAFDGTGTFDLPVAPTFPAVTGTTISSTYFNNIMYEIANNGLSACLPKDGQAAMTGALNMGSFRITNVADAVSDGDAVSKDYLLTSNHTFSGDITLSGDITASGSLSITGTGVISGSNPLFSWYIGGTQKAYIQAVSANDEFALVNKAAGPMTFYTNNTLWGRITSGGSFIWNTATTGGWSTNARIAVKTDSTNAFIWGFSSEADYASGGGAFLGRTNNTAASLASWYYSTTAVGSITTNGTTTAYNTSSDRRIKYDIQPASSQGSCLDKIEVKEFAFNSAPGQRHLGFIAQDLAQVFPDAVSVGDDGDDPLAEGARIWGVDYSKLVPLLVKELQDLRRRVSFLEAIVD